MEQFDATKAVVIIGVIVTLLSFVIYINAPSDLFIATFVLGIVLLVVGYLITVRQNRAATRALEEKRRQGEMNGFMIVLDESYVPFENDATIEYLG